MKLPAGLLIGAVVLFVAGMLGVAEELIVASFVAGGASAAAYIAALRSQWAKLQRGEHPVPNASPVERRLVLMESELERALAEIQQLRAAQEFDRELLGGRREGEHLRP